MLKDKIKKELKILDKIIVSSIILIILLALLSLLIYNASSNYHIFREGKNYFKNDSNLKVMDWMTPHTIIDRFNITEKQFFEQTQIQNTPSNIRTPLYDICRRDKLNCETLVTKINQLVQ